MKAARAIPVYDVISAAGGFALRRDNAIMKTPAGKDFVVPTEELAEAIAGEWRAQGVKIIPSSMPMTQLAATSLDIVAKNPAEVILQLTNYIDSELLCHRAEAPLPLKEHQKKIWQPILDRTAKTYGARLRSGSNMPVRQSAETRQTLVKVIESYDMFRLTGLRQVADISGSLILALAFAEKYLTPMQVFEAAELDALFQMEKWGEDPETAKKQETIRRDLEICEKWFALLHQTA